MAAPVLHCYETGVTSGANISVTVNKPTSGSTGPNPKNAANGDLLLIFVGNDDNTATAQWDNSTLKPTGFTLINEAGDATFDSHCAAFYRVVDGSEGTSFTWSAQSSDDQWAVCVLLSVVASTPLNATGPDAGDSTPTPFSVTETTTSVADCLAFTIASYDGGADGGYTIGGTGWTELVEVRNGTAVGNASGVVATKTVAAAGGTGACTVDPVTDNDMVGFQFAIAPGIVTITGSGTPTADTATADGVAVTENSGSGAPTADTATADGAGVVIGPVSGSGAPTAATATADGTAVTENSGSGAPTAATATADGVAVTIHSGAGAPTADTATADGAAVTDNSGAGAPTAATATADGAGTVTGGAPIEGIPVGWFGIPEVSVHNRFAEYAFEEANTAAVWAYWRYGSNVDLGGGKLPKSHGSANLQLNMTLIQQEADGGAGWARYTVGVSEWNTFQLNMLAALEADFVLT